MRSRGDVRVVFLSSCAAKDLALAERIHRHTPLHAIVRVSWEPAPQKTPRTPWSRIVCHPVDMILRRAQRLYRDWHYRHLKNGIEHEVGSRAMPQAQEVVDAVSWRINKAEMRERIAALEPDILIVSGAPILKPALFRLPRLGAVNVHYGIAPHYRGEHTLFWPLRLGDYDHIGVTVHHIDEGIDTGRILARGYLPLSPSDTEATLWRKSAEMAGEVLVDILEQVKRTGRLPEGSVQPRGDGTLIRAADRRMRHDWSYFASRCLRRHRPPTRQQRIERFY